MVIEEACSRRSFLKLGGCFAIGLMGASTGLLSSCSPADPHINPNADVLDISLIEAARKDLSTLVRKTPLVPFNMHGYDGPAMHLKLENLQLTGSFKLRGATFRISRLTDEEKQKGIATCSAGNHAQGVARAARDMGIKATIFIPSEAPKQKVERTRAYGAEVIIIDETFDDAKKACEEFVEQTGAIYVPPYNDTYVMAGQGTIGLEILDDLPDASAVVVPVGGGGLISGIATAIKAKNSKIKVYGVEAENCPSMSQSLSAGKPIMVQNAPSLADGLDVAQPGDKTFDVVSRLVDDVYTISESQISDAMELLARESKIVAEGAGAVCVAAVLGGIVPVAKDDKVVCVVSGGNVDLDTFAQQLA